MVKGEKKILYERAMNMAAASVVITDTKANIEYVNEHFEKTTEYLADDVIGKNCKLL